MSFYVKRTSKQNAAGIGYTGPIRSFAQAQKEADAWTETGEVCEVLASTAAVKAAVRAWEKASNLPNAREIVTYRGEEMTFAAYKLLEQAGVAA